MTEKRAELLLAAVISARAGVAVLGVALLTVQTGGFTGGVGYGLLAALLYAASIIATDRFSHHDAPLTVGIVQVGVLGLLALIAACCFETPRLRHAVRRGAAPRKDHAAGCGWHPADPVQPAAAPFDERKEIT